jgi:hypothetical protein
VIAKTTGTLEQRRLVLDLEKWRGAKGNRVLAGREYGQSASKEAKLAELDAQDLEIVISVPVDFIAVSSSFFRGMFGDSIRRLGEVEFRRRYKFTGKNIDRVKEDGIRDALREEFPLGRPG